MHREEAAGSPPAGQHVTGRERLAWAVLPSTLLLTTLYGSVDERWLWPHQRLRADMAGLFQTSVAHGLGSMAMDSISDSSVEVVGSAVPPPPPPPPPAPPSPAAEEGSLLPFPARAFWHIGNTGMTTWRFVVAEQIRLLYRSGLVDAMNVTAMYIGPDQQEMPDFLDPRISVEYGGQSYRYEWPTLQRLSEYCRDEPTARVIYFHTKGASKAIDHLRFGWNSYMWRRSMEHFVITLHRNILTTELSDGSPYMTAGVMKRADHYSGNFWMAKCSYINSLPDITSKDLHDRYAAERWIGAHNESQWADVAANCWEPGPDQCHDLYQCYVPECEYLQITTCGGKPQGPPSYRESR